MLSDQSPPDDDPDGASSLAGNSASFPTFGLAEGAASDAAEGTSLVGTSLGGRYQLLELIGAGGFGWVYRARQHFPARDVAIKVPRQPTRMSRRFRDEANLLGTLEHEGIAKVFDAGTFALAGVDTTYVVMQLIRDARRIDSYCAERRLPLGQRLDLFLTVCEAIAHAHRQGIVHRDLKPGNILVDDAGRPYVIDFGIATFMAEEAGAIHSSRLETGATTATQTRGAVGTREYMSPEQRIVGRKVDARADVYALGRVLVDIVKAGAPTHASGLPAGLERVSRRCLEEQPCDRYADAAAVAAAVRESLERDAVPAAPATATDFGLRFPFPILSQPAVIVATAAFLGAGLLLLFAWLRPSLPEHSARPGTPAYRESLQALARSLVMNAPTDAPAACHAAEEAWRNSAPRAAGLPLELAVLRGLATRDLATAGLPHVLHASVDPNGRWLAAGNADKSVSLSRLSEPDRPVHRLSGLRTNSVVLKFSPDGRLLVGADLDGHLCAWNLETIESNAAPQQLSADDGVGSGTGLCSVDFSQDGRLIATADAAGRIGIWTADSGTRLRETVIPVGDSQGPVSVCFDTTDSVVIGCPDGTVFAWPPHGSPRCVTHGHGKGPVLLARSAKAAVIVSAGADGVLVVRDGKTAARLGSPINLRGPAQAIGLTPDGSRLFVASLPSVGHQAATRGILQVFALDPTDGSTSPTPLVDIPVSHRVAAISLANQSCVATIDSPDHPAVVWQ